MGSSQSADLALAGDQHGGPDASALPIRKPKDAIRALVTLLVGARAAEVQEE
jgi:hypothetical protein